MKLSVLLSTIDDGINKVKSILLPVRPDVEYVVSHQYTDRAFKFIPEELKREDIIVSQIPGKGVSRSRNNAILHATGDIALLADDDIKYSSKSFDRILQVYNANEVEVACFKIKTPKKKPDYKNYPKHQVEIKKKSDYWPSIIEMTFLLESIKKNNVLLDERFGLGSRFIGGEEKIFLEDCINKGLKVFFIPQYIVSHPFESSNRGLSEFDEKVIRRNSAVDCRLNGIVAVAKAALSPFKYLPELLKNGINPFYYFYYRLSSAGYILLTNRKYIKN